MPIIKFQVQLFGTIEIDTDNRESDYPIDELLTYMDVEEDVADPQDWAEGMVKFDLDTDPVAITDETQWDYAATKVSLFTD